MADAQRRFNDGILALRRALAAKARVQAPPLKLAFRLPLVPRFQQLRRDLN